jgi:predicted nucleotidyltransferase
MPGQATHPTPYPDINLLLQRLHADVQAVLGQHFVGLYVFGSAASGDFAPPRSDIDFLVVTADELPDELLPALETMHARLTASGLKWATKLEGSYIPQHALRRYDPAHAWHPALRVDGTFAVDHHASDWVIQRHLIREQGVVVAGPALPTLIDPVQPDDLRRAVLGVLREWWSPMLQDTTRLQSREYQAYAVLTMCRALYTLEHGTVVSKAVAAAWAQETLGEPCAPLLERALAWPHDPQPDQLEQTLDCIRYTLERCERYERP